MGAEAVTKARQKRKADLVYIMGGKCSICGYDKCQQALEFHHIDKSTKKFGYLLVTVIVGKKIFKK